MPGLRSLDDEARINRHRPTGAFVAQRFGWNTSSSMRGKYVEERESFTRYLWIHLEFTAGKILSARPVAKD
jgi:hypothetical protein